MKMNERMVIIQTKHAQAPISFSIASIFFRAVFSSDWTWARKTSCTKDCYRTGTFEDLQRETNIQIHTEKVLCAILYAVLNF
jgi:hypothetical protein